ncbi:unnamed protein product [Thelazia callipaeda]|uniref:SH3 domain-containing protein n=1 Tax=Thelazia callipaeda TaxID=103827 RepID=A0A158RC80_THECL|nr:unnamed protein product [Thelazia callipaeda]
MAIMISDHPGLKHQSQDHLSPASTVQRATRAWTPNQQCDSQTDYLKKIELQSRRSKSVGRNVENQHRTIERPYLQCTKNDWHANTESEWRSELNNGSHSGLSSSSFYHYITNNFAQERSKTQHFHLPPYRLQSHDQKRSGVATRKKSARKKRSYSCSLICDNFSWDEMEYLYKAVGGKKGIHMELFTDQLNQLMKSITISGHLDESVIYLQSLLDCLQACASNCNRSSNNNAQRASRSCSVSPALLTTSNNRCSVFKHFDNLTSLPYSSTHSLPYTFSGKTTTNNQCYNHEFEFKKIAKEEVLTRQKVEKLSEELLQQQNRRHGYVPSASPALQKNFSRFSGLINEYGRPERNFASQILSPSEITTCTALFSFKALNSKELSFNRGDVIRVQRVIDVNWMEGERNGQIGIFPSSYVQIDDDKVNEQIKLIALYPFFARNRNELSLKKGETLRYLRAIDVNWIEGKNVHGQVGIFPKSYVRKAFEDVSPDSNETAIPDRPKTPHINTVPYKFVAIIFCMLLAF